MKIPELRGQTLNVFVPTILWTLAVANAAMAAWILRGPAFWIAAAALALLAAGFGAAMRDAAILLRDQAPAYGRAMLYLGLFLGLSAASWDLVPPMFKEEAPLPPPEAPPVVALAEGEWEVPVAPPGPARADTVPENVLDLIPKAQQQLRGEKMDVAQCGGSGEGQARCVCDYLLAVTDKAGGITLVEAYEGKASRPAGYTVKAQIVEGYERACGTNPVLDVSHPPGQTVLAIRTVVKTTKKETEAAVFTPFTDELNIPELREQGLRHWWGVVVKAQVDLRKGRVKSAHVKGALVADLVPAQHVFLLGIIENIGSLAPFGSSGSEEQRLRELQAVLVMYGANGADTFHWRVSRANAYGPLQFTPIYENLRAQYPGVLPAGDWVAGAKGHASSAKAAFLHSDEEFRALKEEWRTELPTHPLLYGMYLAAGYNGSARRVARALENCSAAEWYGVTCPTLRGRNSEGHWYLRKYLGVEPLLFDQKTHARLRGTNSAPESDEDEGAPATE